MQYAAENDYPLFDFMGAGSPDQPYGVRDFKAEFGGELVEHGRFLCIRKPMLYWIGKMGVKWLKWRRVPFLVMTLKRAPNTKKQKIFA
jgi:lipid II:glycine glycyltransferase (peptidoglycan interpeptide bridge formation enzyme)